MRVEYRIRDSTEETLYIVSGEASGIDVDGEFNVFSTWEKKDAERMRDALNQTYEFGLHTAALTFGRGLLHKIKGDM